MQILNFILSIIEDTASSIFSNFILKRIRKNKKDNKEECKKSVDEKKYKTDFAKRIDQLMFLINQEKYYGFEELNLSKLAEYLNLESVEILKQYYKESREPTFQFIDSVAEKLGVNHNWLKNGEGEPFLSTHYHLPEYNNISRNDRFIFAFRNSQDKEFIFVKYYLDESKRYKYITYIKSVPFNNEIGYGGLSVLKDAFKILKKINSYNPSDLEMICKLSNDEYENLRLDKIYPGKVLNYKVSPATFLLDDFIDPTGVTDDDFIEFYGSEIFKLRNKLYKYMKR